MDNWEKVLQISASSYHNASTFKKQKFAGKGFVECLILEVLIPHEDFAFAFYVFINSFIC